MDFNSMFVQDSGKVISIDFGQLFVKIAYLNRRAQAAEIIAYEIARIPQSAQDFHVALVALIENFLKTNSISVKQAYITVSDPDAFIIKHLILPKLPKKEISRALQWQLKDELVGFDWERAVTQWRLVKELVDEEALQKQLIMFTALANVDKYLSVVTSARLIPKGIRTGAFNYSAFIEQEVTSDKPVALLDIGSYSSTLCIYRRKQLSFIRRLVFSPEKLTQALNNTLVTEHGTVVISAQTAELIRNTVGIPLDENSRIEGNIPALQVLSLIRPLLEGLVRELKYSFDYYVQTLKEESPLELLLTGGGASLNNLGAYLSKEMGIPVSGLKFPLDIVCAIDQKRFVQDKNQLANCLAAVYRNPAAVNLLPPQLKLKLAESVEKSGFRLTAFAFVALLIISFFGIQLQLGIYAKRLANVQVSLERLGALRQLQQKIQPFEDVALRISQGMIPEDAILKVVPRLLAGSVVLDELTLSQKDNSLILKGRLLVSVDKAKPVIDMLTKKIVDSSFFKEVSIATSASNASSPVVEIKAELAQ